MGYKVVVSTAKTYKPDVYYNGSLPKISGSSTKYMYENAERETGVAAGLLEAMASSLSDFKSSPQKDENGKSGLMKIDANIAKLCGEDALYANTQWNVTTGAKWMAKLIEGCDGDLDTALAAYKEGTGVAKQGRDAWSQETRDFVDSVNSKIYVGAETGKRSYDAEQAGIGAPTSPCAGTAAVLDTMTAKQKERAQRANVSSLLSTAQGEMGVTEYPANSNTVKYNKWFYGEDVSGKDYAWGGAFVSWCYEQSGIDLPCKEATGQNMLDWYIANSSESIVTDPQPGDIAIYSNGGAGIVSEVLRNGGVKAIDGDSRSAMNGGSANGGCVSEKSHTKGSVLAYIRPAELEMDNTPAGKQRAAAIKDKAKNVFSAATEPATTLQDAITPPAAQATASTAKSASSEYKARSDVKETVKEASTRKKKSLSDWNISWSDVSNAIDKWSGKSLVGMLVSAVAKDVVDDLAKEQEGKKAAQKEAEKQEERAKQDKETAAKLKTGHYNPADFAFLDTGSSYQSPGMSL